MDTIARVSAELGHPGAEALWVALKRRRVAGITKKQVQAYVAQKSEKQVLAAPQRATGKAVSEDDNRWMMDLVEVPNPGEWKYILVCVNVFDRFMYARLLRTKRPAEVKDRLLEILNAARKQPQVISSDGGAEFTKDVSEMLTRRGGIVQRFKDAGDANALGVVDRQIGLLKRKLAERGGWTPQNVQAAVKALNSTPKPGVLHGAAPEEVSEDPEVTFMLMQDQAKALQQNQKVADRKRTAVERTGTFRPQIALGKFKRNYQATYGDPEQVGSMGNGRVTSTAGNTYPLKQVKVVPANASRIRGSAPVRGRVILEALRGLLRGGKTLSLSNAATALRAEVANYDKALEGMRLVDLIRQQPEVFTLSSQALRGTTAYDVTLK